MKLLVYKLYDSEQNELNAICEVEIHKPSGIAIVNITGKDRNLLFDMKLSDATDIPSIIQEIRTRLSSYNINSYIEDIYISCNSIR